MIIYPSYISVLHQFQDTSMNVFENQILVNLQSFIYIGTWKVWLFANARFPTCYNLKKRFARDGKSIELLFIKLQNYNWQGWKYTFFMVLIYYSQNYWILMALHWCLLIRGVLKTYVQWKLQFLILLC